MDVSHPKGFKPIRITIVSQKGKCTQGYKVGDSWLLDELKTPNGMCENAYHSLFQYIRAFRFGATHPWDKEKGIMSIACPDPARRLVYELRVVEEG